MRRSLALALLAALAAPALAEERVSFAYDPDFGLARHAYEVTVRSDLPGAGRGATFSEILDIARSAAGEIELSRKFESAGDASIVEVYDRDWKFLRVEGIAEGVERTMRDLPGPLAELAPRAGKALEDLIGPAAKDVLSALASPAGAGAADPAEFAGLSPVWTRNRSKSTTHLGSDRVKARWISIFEVLALETAGWTNRGTQVCRMRWTKRLEHEGILAPILPEVSVDLETCLHPNGLPSWSSWKLRVAGATLIEIERREVSSND